jgi:peptide/nickel transport system ATP-binding protein/oligopeptide transport system ATP-binding protein
MNAHPLVAAAGLTKYYSIRGAVARPARLLAVDDVDFHLRAGESLGLVGESGCGKSTLGRLILRLIRPSKGRIVFDGIDITRLKRSELRPLRRRMQIIFQDPYASLDPRMRIGDIVTEPLRAAGEANRTVRRQHAAELLETVGLRGGQQDRYPHEFSGGQRQRIGIARALCLRPDLVVADEPVSALDVSIRAQIINLMRDLRDRFNLSYLLISHDLSVVGHLCDRVAVMYTGRFVELAPAGGFLSAPRHPYTHGLLSSVPIPDPRRRTPAAPVRGDPPSPRHPPPGCTFHPRCRWVMDICRVQRPALTAGTDGHRVACHLNGGCGLTNRGG